jgi:hypothetical protein
MRAKGIETLNRVPGSLESAPNECRALEPEVLPCRIVHV